ncbi:hypothetical protein [Streptomyces sp. NPDC050535]|uniref:hypothetical protein n=1 Tax=Streptomyces sp. NPDC050535 TaxID=3365626 RepID=UPI0037BA019B
MGILKNLGRAAKWVGKKIWNTKAIWGPALIGVGIGLAIGGPLALPLAIALGAGAGYMGMRWQTRQNNERAAAQAREAKNSQKRSQLPEHDPRSKESMDPKQAQEFAQFQRLKEFTELQEQSNALKEFRAFQAFQESNPRAGNSQSPAPESYGDLRRSESFHSDIERPRTISPAPSHSAEMARTMPPGFSMDRRGSQGRGNSNAVNVPEQNREQSAGRGRKKK